MAKQITSTIVLKVSGKEVEQSFNGLAGTVKKLERELKKLTPGTAEFIRKTAELKEARGHFEKVKKEIQLVNGKLNETPSLLSRLAKKFLDFGSVAKNMLSVNLIEEFTSKLSETATELIKISDAMADVQKTTGMALNEVKDLWEAFDKMDTRTSKLDRLKITEVGGRLGVPKQELESFVQEVDKAYVALGDSYSGGLEKVVEDLGKIKGLFNETKAKPYAEAINEVGSALNGLAASGTASEDNISEFALRVGSMPDAMKPAIDKVLGLGAAFEESGVNAQIAASGFSNFMKIAGENLGLFAQSMHMSTKEATELFNTNPEEFFLRFAQGMRNVPADETAKIFDSLKINSLEVQKAVGAAANRTDEFRVAMQNANVLMKEATSLNDEFNVKNNNTAAILQKLKNGWNDFLSSHLMEFFDNVIGAIGSFLGVTKKTTDGVNAFTEKLTFLWQIIKIVASALIGYQVGLKLTALMMSNVTKATILNTIVEKARAVQQGVINTATATYNIILALVTFNTNRARNAMIAYNSVLMANPLGLVLGLLAAAIAGYIAYANSVDEATKKQKLFNDINKETNQSLTKQKTELESLLKVVRDETASKEARLKAIQKLNEISPEYLGNLTLENINTLEAKKAIDAYTDSLYKNARAKVLKDKLEKAVSEREDLKNKPVMEAAGYDGWFWKVSSTSDERNLDKNMLKQYEKWKKEYGELAAKHKMHNVAYLYEERNEILQSNAEEIQYLQDELTKMYKETPSTINSSLSNNTGIGNSAVVANKVPKKGSENDGKKSSREALRKSQEDLQKANEEIQNIHRQQQDEILKIQDETRKKEEEQENLSHQRRLDDIERRNQEILQANQDINNKIKTLEEERNKSTSPEAKANYTAAIDTERKVQQANLRAVAENNKLKEEAEITHQHKLNEIRTKWEIKAFKEKAEADAQDIAEKRLKRETEINDLDNFSDAQIQLTNLKYVELTEAEFKNIRTLEEAKKILREEADREVLANQEKILKEQMTKLTQMLNDPAFSKEALKKLKEDLEKITEEYEKVRGTQASNKAGEDKEKNDERNDRLSKIDILGFSAADWEETFKNLDTTEGKIKAVKMAIQAMSNAFEAFAKLQKNLNARELKQFEKGQTQKRKQLLSQLNEGLINQEQYHKGLQELEEETDRKKTELANKNAKLQKAMAVAQITISTAQAIMGIWKDFPKVDFGVTAGIMSGVVGALGAAQIATVLSQPDSFADGGFTGNGFGSADRTGFRPAGIVHENEYVTPKWMLESPVVADVVDWMESIRTGRTNLPRGFADGGYTSSASQKTDAPTSVLPQSTDNTEMVAVLDKLLVVLEDLANEGVDAWIVENAENGKRIKRTLKMFEKIEERNRRK